MTMHAHRLVFAAALATLFMLAGVLGAAEQPEQPERPPMGCFPGGEVFDAFFPDAVPLRNVEFLTPFGTLNTNVVLGDDVSVEVAVTALSLSERLGELLTGLNSSAPDEPVGLQACQVPQKYLKEKTMLLCGGPEENHLVDMLVEMGKSKVDWSKAENGSIEVVPEAFGGQGTAVILAGATPQASSYAIGALAEFFKHVGGAGLAEAWMLLADQQLQRGEIEAAANSMERMLAGLRIDGSANFHAPIKDFNPAFPKLLAAEVEMSRELVKFLRTSPKLEEADTRFRKVASQCAYCHRRYLNYDRMAVNRIKYLYSQYPETRLETEWALAY